MTNEKQTIEIDPDDAALVLDLCASDERRCRELEALGIDVWPRRARVAALFVRVRESLTGVRQGLKPPPPWEEMQ